MKTFSVPVEVQKIFPYEKIRPYQDSYMSAIYDALKKGKHIAIEGANGLGKTVATLSAILPIAKENNLTILYCSRTHKQMDRVVEELKQINTKLKVSGISLRGRVDMCLHKTITNQVKNAKTAMEICQQLKEEGLCKFYKNLKSQTRTTLLIQSKLVSSPITASDIISICEKYNVCPYEIAKSLLSQVDVIALSYVYVFNPVIKNRFFKYVAKPPSEFILVLDEAHNLPDIAVNIASESLSLSSLKRAYKEAKLYGQENIQELCLAIRNFIFRMKPEGTEVKIDPQLLLGEIESLLDEDIYTFANLALSIGREIQRQLILSGKRPRSYIHKLGEFLLKWVETAEDRSFLHLISEEDKSSRSGKSRKLLKLEVVALDPRKITQDILNSVYASVHISGTLEPIDAYKKVIGLSNSAEKKAVPSPFPKENILALVCLGVSTAIEKRRPYMYEKIVRKIAEVARCTPANVGVFAASYEVLQGLLECGLKDRTNKPLLHEYEGMSSREADSLVAEFKSYSKKGGAVLLGVQGGRLSEGVDYPGDEMNSVVIVGIPYAKPLPRVLAQRDFYEKEFPGCGYEYSYLIPALRKASQAAGRPIRTLHDKAAIIFMDYRFSTAYCRKLLPLWIRKSLRNVPDVDGALTRELLLFYGFSKHFL